MTVSGIKEVVDVVLLFRDTSCFHVGMTRALVLEHEFGRNDRQTKLKE